MTLTTTREYCARSILAFLCLSAGQAVSGQESPEGVARPAPNILLFYCDDMGVGDTSAYQSITGLPDDKQMHTPNMDALAAEGVRFTDAHAGATLCSPSRWSLMTGRYPWRHSEVRHNLLGKNSTCTLSTESTLPEILRRGGYRTYATGKWHLGTPNDKATKTVLDGPTHNGFDQFMGIPENCGGGTSKLLIRNDKLVMFDPQSKQLSTSEGLEAAPTEDLSQLFLDHARQWLGAHAPDGKHADSPFFLYYSPFANHEPYLVPEALDGHPVKGMAKTVSGGSARQLIDEPMARGKDKLHRHANPIGRTGMILENDTALGLLRAWLAEADDPRWPGHKMSENTLIVLTSDNGSDIRQSYQPPHGHLTGQKNSQEEGGHREPFLVCWPGVMPGGKTSHALVSQVDLSVTFASIAGVPLEAGECGDGTNLQELFLSPDMAFKRPEDRPLITSGAGGQKDHARSIRDGQWKLTLHDVEWETGLGRPHGLYRPDDNLREEDYACPQFSDHWLKCGFWCLFTLTTTPK